MSRSVEENIKLYVSYFREQVQLVEDHCPKSREGDIHSRILYSAILDAMSKSVSVQNSNRERVVDLLRKFCNWSDCDRISLSHLYQLVRTKTESELTQLRDFAIQNMSNWLRAETIYLNRDPLFIDVEFVWPHKGGKLVPIDGIVLNKLQHCYLFYAYRNSLIHEFRTLGYHAELWEKDEPYYIQVTEYQNETTNELERSWQLQYTALFFKRLCLSAISNLENHFIQNQINPVEAITAGKYWLHELDI